MNIRKISGFLAVIFILFFFNIALAEENASIQAPARVKQARESTVLIRVSQVDVHSNLQEPIFQGSGFFVRNNLIITALHVLGQNLEVIKKNNVYKFFRIKVYFSDGEYEEAHVKLIDRNNDLVLLQIKKNSRPLDIAKEIKNGDEVWFCGFDQFLRHSCHKSLVHSIFKDFDWEPGYVRSKIIIVSGSAAHGNSGGPILNSEGEVVGLITDATEQQPVTSLLGVGIKEEGITVGTEKDAITNFLMKCVK